LAVRPWSQQVGKKLLAVVNPISGTGDAKKIFVKIERIFKLANIPFEGLKTTHAGHGTEIGKNVDPSKYFGVVTISGDGLLNEIFNGICSRPDRATVVAQVPLGIIPGGSGNGLAASLHSQEINSAAYSIIAGKLHPMDVFSLGFTDSKGQPQTAFGFLAVGWAMLSVIDLESEGFRFLGPLRFDIKGVVETLAADSYKAKLEYLPSDQAKPPNVAKQITAGKTFDTPHLKGDRSKWKTIEDDKFFLFLASNLKYIQIADGPHAEGAEMSDGCLDIISLRNVDRMDLLKAMTSFEDGTFAKSPGVETVKALAFTLTLDNTVRKAPVTIDGERVDGTKIDVEVHPAILNVFYDFGE